MQVPNSIGDVVQDPRWLAHRYDAERDCFHFRFLDREGHQQTTFLSEQAIRNQPGPVVIPEAQAAPFRKGSSHFIFHSAYCCSTLLARAFDIRGVSMGLKEPMLLNDLIGWKRRGAPQHKLSAILTHALDLLSREFEPEESVIIKPSNVYNSLIRETLLANPNANALLLYAPLETYLRSIAKKGLWGRIWVRELFIGYTSDQLIQLGLEADGYLRLTDLQIAAAGWVAQQNLFNEIALEFGEARVTMLDSQTLTKHPVDAMTRLNDLFDLRMSSAQVTSVATGPTFNRHSKLGTSYGQKTRDAEHLATASVHGDEIEKVVVWAEAVARHANAKIGATNFLLK